jgi:hypothetical protein
MDGHGFLVLIGLAVGFALLLAERLRAPDA